MKHDANLKLCGVFCGFVSINGSIIHISGFYSHMGRNNTKIKEFNTCVVTNTSTSQAPNCMCYFLSLMYLSILSIYKTSRNKC